MTIKPTSPDNSIMKVAINCDPMFATFCGPAEISGVGGASHAAASYARSMLDVAHTAAHSIALSPATRAVGIAASLGALVDPTAGLAAAGAYVFSKVTGSGRSV